MHGRLRTPWAVAAWTVAVLVIVAGLGWGVPTRAQSGATWTPSKGYVAGTTQSWTITYTTGAGTFQDMTQVWINADENMVDTGFQDWIFPLTSSNYQVRVSGTSCAVTGVQEETSPAYVILDLGCPNSTASIAGATVTVMATNVTNPTEALDSYYEAPYNETYFVGVGDNFSDAYTNITIAPGPPSRIDLSTFGMNGPTPTGTATGFTVWVADQYGNPTPAPSDVTVDLSSTATPMPDEYLLWDGSYGTSLTIPAGSAVSSFWYVDDTPGTPTVSASDASGFLPSSSVQLTYVTDTGNADQIALTGVSGTSAPASSATNLELQLTLEDSSGGLATSSSDVTVLLSSSSDTAEFASAPGVGPGGNTETSVTIPAGSSTAIVYYGDSTPGFDSLSTQDAVGALFGDALAVTIGGTSGGGGTAPSSVAGLVVSSIASPQTAGQPFDLTLSLVDQSGNVVDYSNPDTAISVAPNEADSASLPTSADFESGVASVQVVLDTAQTGQALGFAVDGFGATSDVFDVVPGPPGQIATSSLPSSITAGGTIDATLTIEDAFGNTVDYTDATAPLTVKPAQKDASTMPIRADFESGVASVSIPLDTAVADQSLSFTADGATGTSPTFTVTAGLASELTLTGVAGTSATQSSSTNVGLTVTVADQYGNPALNASNVVVDLSSNSAGGDEFAAAKGVGGSGSTETSVTIPAGTDTATVYYGDATAGSPTLTATDMAHVLSPGTLTVTISLLIIPGIDANGAAIITTNGDATTFAVDPTKLQGVIGGATGESVDLTATTGTADATLSGADLTALQSANATLTLSTPAVSYTFQVPDLRLDAITSFLGVASPADVSLSVTVTPASASATGTIDQAFGASNVLASPETFTVTATGGGNSLVIDHFSAVVPRTFTLALPPVVTDDTGMVLVNGAPEHAWTTFSGNTATIESLTDSTYAVVQRSVTFNDIASLPQAQQEAVTTLADKLILNGESQGVFDPAGGVTRAEFSAMVVRALGLWNIPGGTSFTDVPSGYWGHSVIESMTAMAFLDGFPNGTFEPDARITNAQMAAIVTRVLTHYSGSAAIRTVTPGDASQIPAWATSDVRTALDTGVMSLSANGDFQPGALTTRAQAALIVDNLMQILGVE